MIIEASLFIIGGNNEPDPFFKKENSMMKVMEVGEEVPNIEGYDSVESILERLKVVAHTIKTTPPKKRDLHSNQRYKSLTMETMLLTTKLYVYHNNNGSGNDSSSTLIQKRRHSRSKNKRGEESKFLLQELCGLTSGNNRIKRFIEQYKCPSQ